LGDTGLLGNDTTVNRVGADLGPLSDPALPDGATAFTKFLAATGPQSQADASASTWGSIASTLGQGWDWAKQETSAAGHAVGDFDATHGHVLTRAAGVAQAVGGTVEGITGLGLAGVGGAATGTGVGAAPGVPTMLAGGALAANGLDNAQAGLRTAWTGEFHHTLTAEAAGASARALGASGDTAEHVAIGVDIAQGIGAGVATGAARKAITTIAAEGFASESGILRAAAQGKGNFGIGPAWSSVGWEQPYSCERWSHLDQPRWSPPVSATLVQAQFRQGAGQL
jgi:hypothetical protein